MHFARFFFIFLLITLVQFASSSSPDPSGSSGTLSSTTSKPKTSFTRHFTKILSPLKKLFSFKPKATSPSSQLNVNVTGQPERQSSLADQSTGAEANASLVADPDSVDFNLTEEASRSEKIKLLDLPSPNSTDDSGKTDDVNDEIGQADSKEPSKNEEPKAPNKASDRESDKEPNNETDNVSSDEEGKGTTPFTGHELSTVPSTYETTTSSLYRKRPQKLTEDEMRICLEIDELKVRKCYIQIPSVSNFVHSRNYCETHFSGGRLITINTPDEQQFLILNSVYYFWTAFKVRIGFSSSLTPYVAAIRPIYKQNNVSTELIEKLQINQNLVVSDGELKELISENKFSTYPTNDDDSYEEDDIRLEEPEPIFVLVPKIYCLEASLNFENGQPLFKWVIKDCDQETSSSVCELSEQLEEEDAELATEQPDKHEMKNESKKSEQTNELVNEKVNQLISQFLSGTSNKTKSARPPVVTEPSHIEFRTESAEDERFREILSDLLKEVESSPHTTTAETLSSTQVVSTTLPAESTTTISTTPLVSTTSERPSEQSTQQATERSTTTLESITVGFVTVEPERANTTTDPHRPANSTANCTAAEPNPLIYQLMFAANIAFNSFCSLVGNLFSLGTLDDKELKHSKLIFLSAIILVLLLLLATVLLIVLVTCRYAVRTTRRKRRLLLDTLSEQRYKKEDFSVAIDKKYDDSYYNIPHNRNIYVSNPESRQYLLPNNNEKYKSIPKEYFY